MKTLPVWIAKIASKLTPFLPFTKPFFKRFHGISLKDELDRLFGEGENELKAILNYCFADYGVEPHRTCVGMLCSTYSYYEGGAYYPVGGASEIPYSLIPVIERAGGRVLCNANVTEILLQNGGKKAVGVRVVTTFGPVDIKAPIVISDAGVSNTFRRLLPENVAKRTKIGQLLESGRIHPGLGAFQIFVGIKGSQSELKLPNKNLWMFYDTDVDKALTDWYKMDMESAIYRAKIPFFFLAFPSAKDATYNDRFPDRSSCTILMGTPIEWFQKWEKEPIRKRSNDYQMAKMELARRCWELVVDQFPQLAGRKDFLDAGSPLTVSHYLDAIGGEPYGLDNDTERFAPDIVAALRPKVPEIGNLYLTGQDVLSCGFVATLYSSFLTCQAILEPLGECTNLLGDLKQLYREPYSKKARSEFYYPSPDDNEKAPKSNDETKKSK